MAQDLYAAADADADADAVTRFLTETLSKPQDSRWQRPVDFIQFAVGVLGGGKTLRSWLSLIIHAAIAAIAKDLP